MRVVDPGDVVQAEPSSGEKAASIVSFLKKSAMATKEQAVERHRKMHDTQRDALCAEVTARKQRERYPAHEVADTEIGRNLGHARETRGGAARWRGSLELNIEGGENAAHPRSGGGGGGGATDGHG